MKQKPYTNFDVPDTLTLETAQEPCKTNHDALEDIRKQQMVGRVERPAVNVVTYDIETLVDFNDWSKHIHNLLIKK